MIEKSCGGIVFTIRKEQIFYVIIEEASGFHSLPKGHVEDGESEEQTAIREIEEETGLKLDLIQGFRMVDEYVPREKPDVTRQIVYFLAEYLDEEPYIVRPDEVRSIKVLNLEDALNTLEYDGIKSILATADQYIKEHIKGIEIWDAYNRDFTRIPGETLVRGEGIPEGQFHLVVDIAVKHIDGTYLLMQRDFKKLHGGLWEFTAGGSALKGEEPLEAAKRELLEETSITGELKEIGRVVQDENRSIYAVYFCETDIDKKSITLQKGETIDYKWISKQELYSFDEKELASLRVLKLVKEQNL